jgi:hypothetical protein
MNTGTGFGKPCANSKCICCTETVHNIFLEERGCGSPFSTTKEVLNSCQDGTNMSICLGIMLENTDTVSRKKLPRL